MCPYQPEMFHVESVCVLLESQKPQHFFLERYADSYVAEWSHFVEALVNKQAAEDGQRALVLAEAAIKSLQTGQPVVPDWA